MIIEPEIVKVASETQRVAHGSWDERVEAGLKSVVHLIAKQARDELALSDTEEALVAQIEQFEKCTHAETRSELLAIIRRRFPKRPPPDPVMSALVELKDRLARLYVNDVLLVKLWDAIMAERASKP